MSDFTNVYNDNFPWPEGVRVRRYIQPRKSSHPDTQSDTRSNPTRAFNYDECNILIEFIYNSHGSGPDRVAYINTLLKRNDIICIQEHWLFDSALNKLENSLTNAYVHGISGMKENELITGRPFGGVAIVWNKTIKFHQYE